MDKSAITKMKARLAPELINEDDVIAEEIAGRPGMAIYDPLAAIAMADPGAIEFTPCAVSVSTAVDTSYGRTTFTHAPSSPVRRAAKATQNLKEICIRALERTPAYGPRPRSERA